MARKLQAITYSFKKLLETYTSPQLSEASMNETVQEFDLMKNMALFKQGASASLVFNNALYIIS